MYGEWLIYFIKISLQWGDGWEIDLPLISAPWETSLKVPHHLSPHPGWKKTLTCYVTGLWWEVEITLGKNVHYNFTDSEMLAVIEVNTFIFCYYCIHTSPSPRPHRGRADRGWELASDQEQHWCDRLETVIWWIPLEARRQTSVNEVPSNPRQWNLVSVKGALWDPELECLPDLLASDCVDVSWLPQAFVLTLTICVTLDFIFSRTHLFFQLFTF